jgi:phasin family protein
MKETLETVTAQSNAAFKDAYERMTTAATEMNGFAKESMEAFLVSAKTAGKGVEDVNAHVLSYMKGAMEHGMAAAKSMTAAKSFQEIVEIQADYAKSALETYLSELNKITDLVASSAKESMKPLNERATAFMTLVQNKR